MRKYLIVFLLLSACQSQSTSNLSVADKKKVQALNDNVCEKIGDGAALAMRSRQEGIPLSTVLKASKTDFMRSMFLSAYNTNIYYSEAGKQKAIQEFRNKAEIACQNHLR